MRKVAGSRPTVFYGTNSKTRLDWSGLGIPRSLRVTGEGPARSIKPVWPVQRIVLTLPRTRLPYTSITGFTTGYEAFQYCTALYHV